MQELIIQTQNKTRFLTLNRPEKRNALNYNLMKSLSQAISEANNDPEVKVIVINSTSDKAFCAGLDLKELKEFIDNGKTREYFQAFSEIILALEDGIKPTISVVRGYALAGGCGIAVGCDITIASVNSKFGIPEINIDMWPMIISYPLLKFISPKKVLELSLTGRIIEAKEAKEIGMVSFLLEDNELDNFLSQILENLSSRELLTLKMGKEAFGFLIQDNYNEKIKYLREMSAILANFSKHKIEKILKT